MHINSKIYLFCIFLFSIYSCSDHTHTKNVKKETAAYSLPVPAKWKTEKFKFPPAFASQLPYTGDEDIRFSPGWEFTSNDEHWAYSFLWWLDGNVKPDTASLQEHLKMYYTGLIGSYVKEKNIPGDKVIPITTIINKIATITGDNETYNGTVTMVDYLDVTFNPITLNCLVHTVDCSGHTAVIFEISPRPYEHNIWKQLHAIRTGFNCK